MGLLSLQIMSLFTNSPRDWDRLDWKILRDGGIGLYWRREYLIEDAKWFGDRGYRIYEFDCATWGDEQELFSQVKRTMCFPEWFGHNFDALNDCMSDLELPQDGGAAIILDRFDVYATGPGSSPLPGGECAAVVGKAWTLLDILARATRFHLLNGGRVVTLVQSDDPTLQIGKLGGETPQWNRREWLNANRQPSS